MKNTVFAIAAAALVLSACSNDEPGTPAAEAADSNVFRNVTLTAGQREVAAAAGTFGWDLLKNVVEAEPGAGNIAVSPLSVAACLSMLANGADGDTRTDILRALGYDGMDMETVNGYYSLTTTNIRSFDKTATLNIANSLWTNPVMTVKDDFLKLLASVYDMEAYSITESYATDMDEWCTQHTDGNIKGFFKGQEDPKFAILNALYFKGQWSSADLFDKTHTKDGEFTAADGSVYKVPFMRAESLMRCFASDEFTDCSINFGNGAFSFHMILPGHGYSVSQALEALDTYGWCSIANSPYVMNVTLHLPRFSVVAETDLKPALKAMGMERVFDGPAFPYLSDKSTPLTAVRQKMSFTVDETGAEASAATSAEGTYTSPFPAEYYLDKLDFRLDRTFIYAVVENNSKTPVIAGVVDNPLH